jgi:glycine cleavage system pyridoxal-binding protein P
VESRIRLTGRETYINGKAQIMQPKTQKNIVYLYIPNSVPAKKEEMLRVVNARSVEELYGDITESIRFKCKINLPKPLLAEA